MEFTKANCALAGMFINLVHNGTEKEMGGQYMTTSDKRAELEAVSERLSNKRAELDALCERLSDKIAELEALSKRLRIQCDLMNRIAKDLDGITSAQAIKKYLEDLRRAIDADYKQTDAEWFQLISAQVTAEGEWLSSF